MHRRRSIMRHRLPSRRPPAKDWDGRFGILFGVVIALIAANVYLYMQLDKVKKDLTTANDTAQSRIDKLEEAANVSTQSNRRTVEQLARPTGACPPASEPGRRRGQG